MYGLNLSGAPGGVEEVLVILEGIHQPIPTGAAPEDKMASPLPAPPSDDKQVTGVPAGPGQTEADKTIAEVRAVGQGRTACLWRHVFQHAEFRGETTSAEASSTCSWNQHQ